MSVLIGWLRRLAGMFAGSGRERELNDELAAHVEMHTDDNIRLGLSAEEARRQALARLGGVQATKQRYREQRGVPTLEHLGQDVRHAARTLRRTPGFTALALLTIALGVAGPTVVFTMAKQWILDPLPFLRPGDLVDLRTLDRVSGNRGAIAVADFLDWQRDTPSFDELAGYRRSDVRLMGLERAERVRGAQVTPNFFAILGVHAALGRLFEAVDGQATTGHVAIISDAMWRREFSSDPAIVGRIVRLDNADHVVVGVLPESFQFTLLGSVDAWMPLIFNPEEASNRRQRSLIGLGRLRHDHTIEQARAELSSVTERLSAAFPDTNSRRSARVVRLADEVRLHHDAGIIVPVLFAMMCCVLLVACVNVTTVLLARASTRREEMAVRLALGASRARIIRQWLVEHVLLFIIASVIGAVLAAYGTAWITQSIPVENRQFLRNYGQLSVDGTRFAFALAVGVICAIAFGSLPAWTSAGTDVTALRDASTRVTAGKAGTRFRAAFVMSEVALSLALLIGAGLLVATARNITSANVGFEPRQLMAFGLSLDERNYREPADIRAFYERLTTAIARLPTVTAAGAASLVPFGTEGRSTEVFFEGRPDPTPAETPSAALSPITVSYEEAIGLRLRHGRLFTAADGVDTTRAALINETLAARYFAGRDPLGQRLRLRRTSTEFWQVVGVVADVKNYESTDAAEPQVYLPFAQSPQRDATMIVRSSTDPQRLVASIREAVATIDPAEPIDDLASMEQRITRNTAGFDTVSTFVAFFGAVTLLLAGVGVYGVVAFSFAQRTREIGIRMALGARRADVAALVLRQLRSFLIGGFVPGLMLAWALGQAMKTFLYGVTPTDWRVYLGMSALLMIVAFVAVLVPARRAVAVDPTVALRYE